MFFNGSYAPQPRPKTVYRTFYDFEDFATNPPSRQVRRQIERRQRKVPVYVKVKDGMFGTRKMRVA